MAYEKLHDGGESSQRLFLDKEALRRSVEGLVRSVLEEEVARFIGAQRYERTDSRRANRNGSKPRTMKTCVGELHFDVPQVREGGFRTQVFERYQRSDRALVVAIQEMYVKGVSTRKVGDVLEQMGGFELSAASVSRAASDLDEQVRQWRMRPLTGEYPYLVVDARYEKVRSARQQVVSQAVLVVAGISHTGRREILGVWNGDSESEQTWGQAFSELLGRGLSGVELVVSDAHKGIRKAVDRHFQGCLWQRCKVHWMREALKKCSWRDEKEVLKDLRAIFASCEREQCLAVAAEVALKWHERNAKLSTWISETVEECVAVWHLPAGHRRKLNSTNMIERVMRELKRRSRVVSIFPNEASLVRLMGAVLLEMDEQWQCERAPYLSMDAVEMTPR
jgi:putative transposase